MTDFLYPQKQGIVINRKHSSWVSVEAAVPQGSILGPLYFQIYKSYLSDDLASNQKLFADDTSLFSVAEIWFKQRLSQNKNLGIPIENET